MNVWLKFAECETIGVWLLAAGNDNLHQLEKKLNLKLRYIINLFKIGCIGRAINHQIQRGSIDKELHKQIERLV